MEKNFIKYEAAKELKRLGFNIPCFGYFLKDNLNLGEYSNYLSYDNSLKLNEYPAPIYQQVIDWFEEKYQLEILVESWIENKIVIYLYTVNILGVPSTYRHGEYVSSTRRGAYDRAILEAITKIKK